jgi:serine/threonine protein kinase
LDYALIMEYAKNGNLRYCLTEITNDWYQRLFLLCKIVEGLNIIHKENLIHCNFHNGNILCNQYNDSIYFPYISDYLGSYQFAKSFLKKGNIYGVMPFIAPEVLKGKLYTQASDIYSFSMIMWEFTSKIPPFNDEAHDIQLAYSICKGKRPEIIKNTPQCYIDLMKKCWDEDPLKRPSASEILNIIKNWVYPPSYMDIKNISAGLKNNIMEFVNAPIESNNLITESHSQAYYTSRLLDFTTEELNEILKGSLELKFFELKFFELKFFELKQNQKMIAEIPHIELETKQKELEEMQSAYQKIKLELANLQQQNYQLEQDLRFNSAVQIREFAEKENNLQDQIISLQSEKQALANNLTEQLKQNKLTYQQIQIQISWLEQEKLNLHEKLTQTEANIQDLKFQQKSLVEQKKQLENQELTYKEKAELKTKLKEEITQLEKKLINEEQIKVQFTQALQIKEDKINKLEKELINLDEECIKQLTGKEKELGEIEQEINKTSVSYNNNRRKQILSQVNKFLKAKDDHLTLREETIKKLQKQYKVINDGISVSIFEEVVSEMKKFQDILIKCNEVGLSQMDKDYNSLMNIVQENEELEVSHKICDILKLNSFNFNKYKIFTIATNGTRAHLDPGMMAEDLKLLKKNLDELKSELGQQKKELKNLLADWNQLLY